MKQQPRLPGPLKLAAVAALVVLLNGCVLTKVVTVPMRIGGAIISVVPVIGNEVDDAIDTAADVVDAIPI
ncbi:hypothetical protein GCM10011348_27380 [Marinobacterium nitratireducens]|uniref:Uncharacterized protein n=1 Tax=Marinobacterium nitratireducens TaxID=518897 RepID=A0A918DUX8_9GAMM|nr:DUF6726 family protein [Marinobacterium nitratireducens]GGO83488.1 hypothetical protein GCM10011348_27380 [Marinobacterium nitratireducens]